MPLFAAKFITTAPCNFYILSIWSNHRIKYSWDSQECACFIGLPDVRSSRARRNGALKLRVIHQGSIPWELEWCEITLCHRASENYSCTDIDLECLPSWQSMLTELTPGVPSAQGVPTCKKWEAAVSAVNISINYVIYCDIRWNTY